MGIFKSRLPSRQDAFVVLGVIVFAVFSWSIRGFFFIFPSIVLRYAAGEIFAIFSYMETFALLESLLFLGGLIVLSAVLPKTWLRDGFSYKGFLIVLLGSIASILYQTSLGSNLPDAQMYYLWAGGLALLAIGSILLFHFIQRWQAVLISIAERFTVFAYLYIPIGCISLTVVVFRNLFSE